MTQDLKTREIKKIHSSFQSIFSSNYYSAINTTRGTTEDNVQYMIEMKNKIKGIDKKQI
jgi:hypothetical protein